MEENNITESIPQIETPIMTDSSLYTQTVKSFDRKEKLWLIPAALTLVALSVSAAAWLGMNL